MSYSIKKLINKFNNLNLIQKGFEFWTIQKPNIPYSFNIVYESKEVNGTEYKFGSGLKSAIIKETSGD